MQVRQVIAAALLAVTAVGAMSQEIDPSENLQGKSLAAARPTGAGRSRASVVAETRNLKADGQLNAVGERADAPAVTVVPQTAVRRPHPRRREVRAGPMAPDPQAGGRRPRLNLACDPARRPQAMSATTGGATQVAPPVFLRAATMRGC